MATFNINKKHGFKFEFIVDGKKHTETIYIDMTDKKLPQRMMNAQEAINNRINYIKINDVELKSEGIPQDLGKIEDGANLSEEQIDDIKNVAGAVFSFYDEAEKMLVEEIGNALGTDVSPAFKYCSAFDVINEEYYVALFLESLSDEIIKYYKEHPQQQVNFDKKPYMRKYLK